MTAIDPSPGQRGTWAYGHCVSLDAASVFRTHSGDATTFGLDVLSE